MARQRPARDDEGPDRGQPPGGLQDQDRPLPPLRGVLTQAEIAALLRPDLPEHIGKSSPPAALAPHRAPVLDTALPDAVEDRTRRQAGQLAARLALAFGRNIGLKAAIMLSEVARTDTGALPGLLQGKATAIACFGPDDMTISQLVCLPARLVDALIARACGASLSTGRPSGDWQLSAIDCALLEQLVAPLGRALGDGLELQSVETDIPFVVSTLASGPVSIAEFGLEAPELRSEIAVITTVPDAETARSIVVDRDLRAAPITAVLTARLARLSVPMSRLTDLQAGSTLLLGLPTDQPVEVLSGGRDGAVAFEGQMGRKGNRIAVRISARRRSVLADL